ncbi:MAG: hypothetical protein QOJ75_1902, partial [Chloroflexota bacterium]|nr:hypothetical protein [Chloroflexota bacterium]
AIAVAIEKTRTLGDGDGIGGERHLIVALGWRVREPMAAQVHRHRPATRPKPARDRRPRPGGVRETMQQQHARRRAAGSAAIPIEEVDPVARRNLNHEAIRLHEQVR